MGANDELDDEEEVDSELEAFQDKFQPGQKHRTVIPIGAKQLKGRCKLEAVEVDDYLTPVEEGQERTMLRVKRRDIVMIAGSDNGGIPYPFLACVHDIWLDKDDEDEEADDELPPRSGVRLLVNWLYRREELVQEAPHMHVEFQSFSLLPKAQFEGLSETGLLNEVFFSSFQNEVIAENIMHRCVVHFLRQDDLLPIRIARRGKQSVKVLAPGFVCKQFYFHTGDKMFYLDEELPEEVQDCQEQLTALLKSTKRLRQQWTAENDLVLPPSLSPATSLPDTMTSPASHHPPSVVSAAPGSGQAESTSASKSIAPQTEPMSGMAAQKRPRQQDEEITPKQKRGKHQLHETTTSEQPDATALPSTVNSGKADDGDDGLQVDDDVGVNRAAGVHSRPKGAKAKRAISGKAGEHPSASAGDGEPPSAGSPSEGAGDPEQPLPKGICVRKSGNPYEVYAKVAGKCSCYIGRFKTLTEAAAMQQAYENMTLEQGLEALTERGLSTKLLRQFMGLVD